MSVLGMSVLTARGNICYLYSSHFLYKDLGHSTIEGALHGVHRRKEYLFLELHRKEHMPHQTLGRLMR